MIDYPEGLRELASCCAQMTQGETDPLIQQIAKADILMLRGAADEIERLRGHLDEVKAELLQVYEKMWAAEAKDD